jgi:hypothetical protein
MEIRISLLFLSLEFPLAPTMQKDDEGRDHCFDVAARDSGTLLERIPNRTDANPLAVDTDYESNANRE